MGGYLVEFLHGLIQTSNLRFDDILVDPHLKSIQDRHLLFNPTCYNSVTLPQVITPGFDAGPPSSDMAIIKLCRIAILTTERWLCITLTKIAGHAWKPHRGKRVGGSRCVLHSREHAREGCCCSMITRFRWAFGRAQLPLIVTDISIHQSEMGKIICYCAGNEGTKTLILMYVTNCDSSPNNKIQKRG